MRKKLVLLLCLISICFSNYIYASELLTYGTTTAVVERVHDGDTIIVNIKGYPSIVGQAMPVRINKINTPELNGHCDQESTKAIEARDFVKKYLPKGMVVTFRNMGRDKYFRILADVYDINGNDIAKLLLENNLAHEYDGKTKQSWCK